MKSQLIIPTFAAVVIHLGLLFGFDSRPEAQTFDPIRAFRSDRPSPVKLLPPQPPDLETEPEAGSIDPTGNESRVEGFEPKVMTRTERSLPVISGHSGAKDGAQIQVFGGPVQVNSGKWGQHDECRFRGGDWRDALDHAARDTYQKSPVDPLRLRREGIEGVVEVSFVVDQSGRVETATR